MMNKSYNIYFDPEIEGDDIVVCGIDDFKCGDPLFLINIDKTATGKISEIVDNRNPGFYIGDHLASQLVIDIDPDGDVIHVMKIIPPNDFKP